MKPPSSETEQLLPPTIASELRLLRNRLDELLRERSAPSSSPELTVILAVYNEEPNLYVLHERLTATLRNLGVTYELIFVNDGSTDKSSATLRALCTNDPNAVAIDLTRNFGQQAAFSAGLDYARGTLVAVMDSDLQDPPEALEVLYRKQKDGFDVVYAIRVRRKEGPLIRLAYKIFYRLLKLTADIDIPLDAGDFCIMHRRVVEHVKHMPERNRFLRGMRSWIGFSQVGVEVERSARFSGEAKYGVRKLFRLAVDGLTSFSFLPLRLISFVGVGISGLSILLAIFYAIKKLLVGLEPPGFATLVVLLCLFSGIQLVTIGVIGEYLGRIFDEVKQRPIYIVRSIYRASE